MKVFKLMLLTLTLAMTSATFIACGGDSAADKAGKEYTSAYICPMHCEGSGSEEAGKCPVCGMDYVANEDQKGKAGDHDGHDHDHGDHDGHNH